MLPLQVLSSRGEMASIVPNLPVAEKPQATSLKKPKSRAAPGLVPRRLQGSPSSLAESECSGSWGWNKLLRLESSC